jgi:HEAT repeat protein
VSMLFPSRVITVDAALRDIKATSPRARLVAAQALGDVGEADHARVRPALCAALEDDVAAVRAEAAGSLGEVGGDDADAVAGLVKRLDDGDAGVRQAAAIALGTMRAAGGFTPLVRALREGPADLRFQAASSLVEIDPLASYEPLAAAVGDSDPQVAGAVALALGSTGDARAPALVAHLMDHDDAGVRFDAAYALAQLGDGRGAGVLTGALLDGGRDWDAVIALEKVGDGEAAGHLASLFERKKTSPEVQARAAGAILTIVARTGDGGGSAHAEKARAHLVAALDNRRDTVRGIAVDELGNSGGAWALAPLQALSRRRRGRDLADEIARAIASIEGRAR